MAIRSKGAKEACPVDLVYSYRPSFGKRASRRETDDQWRPSVLAGAVLLRATLPLSQPPRPELDGKGVLILSGATDALISLDGATQLATALTEAGANVIHRTLPVGHELSQADVSLARKWLDDHSVAVRP